MKPATTLTVLFFTASLSLSVPLQASGQQPKEWTWKDAKGNVRSRAELDAILSQHKLWLDSDHKSGTQADLRSADLSGADLNGADLNGAHLNGAILDGADLDGADLIHTDLSGADLTDSDLIGADLIGAHLDDASLSGGILDGADLSRAVFQPKTLPTSDRIALEQGLEQTTYYHNPGPLTDLRKQFQEAGYREQERAITCALNREEAERDSPIERWFKRIAFDYTCQYGFTPGRPLLIVVALWLLCSGIYAWFVRRPGPSGIYLIAGRGWEGKSNTRSRQVRPHVIRPTRWWKLPFLWLPREWRVLRAAMSFSLMSAFNIGFRDINCGRWLRMLTKREYDLKAVGWARTVSGFQSLLSVYLIALWVLTYFGRPFG